MGLVALLLLPPLLLLLVLCEFLEDLSNGVVQVLLVALGCPDQTWRRIGG